MFIAFVDAMEAGNGCSQSVTAQFRRAGINLAATRFFRLLGLPKELAFLIVQTERHILLRAPLKVHFPPAESRQLLKNVVDVLHPKDIGKSFFQVLHKLLKVWHFFKVVPASKHFAQTPYPGAGAAQCANATLGECLPIFDWTTENSPHHFQGNNLA